MVKMKKVLVVLLIAVCFIFTGCVDTGAVALIQNSDGTIVESYFIPYAEKELLNTNKISYEESSAIKQNIKEVLDGKFNEYLNAYLVRVDNLDGYTDEEKKVLKESSITISSSFETKSTTSVEIDLITGQITETINGIQYDVKFENSTAFTIFKNVNSLLDQPKEVVVSKTLFTTTTKVVKDPVFDNIAEESITLGNYVSGAAEGVIISTLAGENPSAQAVANANERWNAIKLEIGYTSASELFTYCYVVPTARLKSNADQVVTKDGYYFHYWQITSNNSALPEDEQVHFEYWTTTANKPVWYAFTVCGAIVVMLVTYFVAHKKEKQEIQEFKDKLDI